MVDSTTTMGRPSRRMLLGLLGLLCSTGGSAQTSTTTSSPGTSTPSTGASQPTPTTTTSPATTTTSLEVNLTTTSDPNNATKENATTTVFVYPTVLGNTTLETEAETSTLEGWWTVEETPSTTSTPSTPSTPTSPTGAPEPPIDRSGPLKCFYKPAAHSGKPRLETCGVGEDACLIAYMRHQDGQLYTRQKCINTEMEAPFYADMKELEEEQRERRGQAGRKRRRGGSKEKQGGACRDWPLDGTYICACDYSGCNWEKHSAGYIPPLRRLLPPLLLLVILACLPCCCCICCGGQKKGVVHSR